MKKRIKIVNARIVNEEEVFDGELFIDDGKILRIINTEKDISPDNDKGYEIIDAGNNYLIPGIIDTHVHFREPGLTHKADIFTESRSAAAGGVTSFMEMPNTVPQTLTNKLLEDKYRLGAEKSLVNYSFYLGASNHNIDEIKKTDPGNVCGIKVFMGASTGNMLVNNQAALKNIFSGSRLPVVVHCEDDEIIRQNLSRYKEKYGEDIPIKFHPQIRSEEACFRSSSLAVQLAHKYDTRIHLLHLSTKKELELLNNLMPLDYKRITAEVCIHHLCFDESDYELMGTKIKWNPAVKTKDDKKALLQAIYDDRIDTIATDHAPHNINEKQNTYIKAPSGGPMVQHSLAAMLEFFHSGKVSLENIVRKMCHSPADCFNIKKRGYIREGYWADLVIVDLNLPWKVDKSNILYKCGWSPFEGRTFNSKITHTFVNGNIVFDNGKINNENRGMRLTFDR